MHDAISLLRLTPNALRVYFILRELGPLEMDELLRLTGKSIPTVYRGLGELLKNQLVAKGIRAWHVTLYPLKKIS